MTLPMHRSAHASRALALTLIPLAAACDAPRDPGSPMDCDTAGAPCPPGYACDPTRARCVPVDRRAPSLLRADVTPAAVRAGVVVTVTVTTDEPLGAPPSLALHTTPPIILAVTQTGDGVVYFRYTATGAEPEGDVALSATLTDRDGNHVTAAAGTIHFDFTPPALLGASLSAAEVVAGGTVQVTLVAGEPLGEPPALATAAGAACRHIHGDGAAHAFTCDAPPDAAGGDVVLHASLRDVAGNVSAGLAAGHFAVTQAPSGTAPRITGVATDRGAYGTAPGFDVVTLTLDAPPGAADAHLGDRPFACDPRREPSPQYTCRYTVTGREQAGPHTLAITVTDPRGRAGAASASIRLDFDAPRLDAARATPAVASPGDEIVYVVTAGEPLSAPPRLRLSGGRRPPELTYEDGTAFVFRHLVPAGAEDATYAVLVDLIDEAGNPATGLRGAPVRIDAGPPHLLDVATDRVRYSRVPGFDEVVLTFAASEPLARVDAALDGRAMACEARAGVGLAYECRYTLHDDEPEGDTVVRVVAADEAGGLATAAAIVTLDFRAPSLVLAAPLSTPLGAGAEVVYLVAADEPLGAPPVVAATGPSPFTFDTARPANGAGVTRLTHRVINTDTDGTYAIAIDLLDVAGNAAAGLPGAPFVLDLHAPVITALEVTPPSLGPADTLTVRFDLDEDTGTAPGGLSVTAADRAMSCGPRRDTSPRHTCTLPVAATGAGADRTVLPVVVTARDAAGNLATATAHARIDVRAPALVAGSEAVEYLPATGNPLSAVAAATAGTTVRVRFALDESLARSPTVTTTTPAALPFALVERIGNAYVYALTVRDRRIAQGQYAVRIEARDDAGNTAVLAPSALAFVVDTEPPASADVAREGGVVHHRAPWGSLSGGPTASFAIDVAPGAAEPGAHLLALDGPCLGAVRVMGRGHMPAGLAATRLALVADTDAAYLAVVDDAGNASDTGSGACGAGAAAARVEEVSWTATLAGKVRGSDVENPHRLEERHWFTAALRQPDAVEAYRPYDLSGVDGAALATEGRGRWTRHGPPESRLPTTAVATFDAVAGHVVIHGFNGNELAQGREQTWSWDGIRAERLDPVVPGRGPELLASLEGLAHDTRRDRLVLAVREWRDDALDIWEWDRTRWTAFSMNASPSGPCKMVHDPVRGGTYVFGAEDGVLTTRVWDGATLTRVATPEPDVAGDVRFAVLDAATGDFHVGVSLWYYAPLSLWSWDGASWRESAAAAPGGPEGVESAVWDEAAGALLVLTPQRMWAWDDAGWRLLIDLPMPDFYSAAMAYDPLRQRTVITHAWTGLWEYDGSRWLYARPDPEVVDEGGRGWRALAWDDAASVMRLRGNEGVLSVPAADNWTWDGHIWRNDAGVPALPGLETSVLLTFDHAAGAPVLLRGDRMWRRAGDAWQDLGLLPVPASDVAAVASDRDRRRIVLARWYGATYAWDGSAWRTLAAGGAGAAEGPRGTLALAYDEARQRVVCVAVDDMTTWELDVDTWRRVAVTDPEGDGSPYRLYDVAATYDRDRRVVVLAGASSRRPGMEVWELDGTSWRRRLDADPLGHGAPSFVGYWRDGPAMAYDPVRRRLMVTDRHVPDTLVAADVWERDDGAEARPGHVLSVLLPQTGGAAGSRGCAGGACRLLSMAATWHGGGRGFDAGGAAVEGTDLHVWEAAHFAPVAASTGATGAITWSTDDAARLARLADASGRVHFALTTAGTNGRGPVPAAITTDAVELTVRYR